MLQERFQLIFIDAPCKCAPGPGVLPVFEGLGPYFRWVAWGNSTGTHNPEELEVEEQVVGEKLEEALAREGNQGAPFLGVMRFSQGAQVAAGMLLRKQTGELKNQHLRFGVLLAGTYPPISQPPQAAGACDPLIRIPRVHMRGSDDAYLAQGKPFLPRVAIQNTASMVFKGGHHPPTSPDDTKRLADLILRASEQSIVDGTVTVR